MPKHRVGLQKDFSTIFEGVWIPQKQRDRYPLFAPNQEHKRQIEQIIKTSKCPKDFECYKSGFKNLCKVKIIRGSNLIECLPENKQSCEFRLTFVDTALCKCQVRYYIAKNLHL